MATAAQSDILVPATQLLQEVGGRPVLLYEEGEPVAAIVSMDNYEIVRRKKWRVCLKPSMLSIARSRPMAA